MDWIDDYIETVDWALHIVLYVAHGEAMPSSIIQGQFKMRKCC